MLSNKLLAECLIDPWPEGGNITCPNSPIARGKFIVTSGTTCNLYCNTGYVTLDAKKSQCYDGRLTRDLGCVLPGAMIVVGGRSNSLGVLSSVELITSGQWGTPGEKVTANLFLQGEFVTTSCQTSRA